VRIFTTEEELPFAGHPTLGTASLLRAIAPESVRSGCVTLALNVGAVPVRFEESANTWPARGEMTQRDPEFGAELDADEVAAMIGLQREDLNPDHPVQIVSTGTAFAIVPLRSAGALARLKVKHEEASEYLRSRGARWFYVLGPENEAGNADDTQLWRARMQFNGGEDPATGSAAGCAISYLVHRGIVASEAIVHLRQGIEIRRPSDLYLRAALKEGKVTQVRVSGSTILVAKGQLFLP
jgi:trans-2,3-dihydro-3-hydroxyanthranilate isomerase